MTDIISSDIAWFLYHCISPLLAKSSQSTPIYWQDENDNQYFNNSNRPENHIDQKYDIDVFAFSY